MRRRFVGWCVGRLGMAAALLFGSVGAGAQTWTEYRPAGGGFRVEMPGTPQIETSKIEIDGGRVATQRRASVRLPKTDYTVAYMDYPPDIGHRMPPERLLERVRDNIARHGELRSDAALTIGGAPAREFVVATGDNVTIVMRTVWFTNRLFQITVMGSGSGVGATPASRRFLDSFALVKP
ncbi:hypothetical protein [Reyranella massiliensis]|uniref:hypothetical protein n=1 Tax=Reyranella massiliensis TaxID=445220 RepID=UPI0011D21C38|nr:hypothetical protein [Reyranella massiliensis]